MKMTNQSSECVDVRYDFCLLYDVMDGNPNGDPDAGNLPRIDPETGHGLVTDVCLKRKIRNYVDLMRDDVAKDNPDYAERLRIFIREKAVLNNTIDAEYDTANASSEKIITDSDKTDRARRRMCEYYYDVRTFGAVMSTGKNAGQVRGPIQITFSRSIDPIVPSEHSITRMAVTTEKDSEAQKGGNRTMGRKATVPYGLYRCHGFISASLAEQTSFSQADLNLFWEAVQNMFEHDRSAARGLMSVRKLIVFKHASKFGNAPASQLFDLISVKPKRASLPIRCFQDYEIEIDRAQVPEGVELIEMI